MTLFQVRVFKNCTLFYFYCINSQDFWREMSKKRARRVERKKEANGGKVSKSLGRMVK